MKFTKIQGAGNDFIIINNMELRLPAEVFPKLAKRLCQRRTSLGADGFILVDYPESNADFRMHFYNPDGSLGEMCGNGARCIARYAFINKIADNHMKFETGAGIIYAEILEKTMVKVQLNNPELVDLNRNLEIDGTSYECSYIELGSPGIPHAVVRYLGLKDIETSDILNIGKQIRYSKIFPKGANVNFYDLLDEKTAVVKTYERGVENFTLACGTGSASVAVVLYEKHYSKSNNIKIIVPGGELLIELEKSNDKFEKIYLIGPTNIIAVGEIMDEEL